jgi:hypothetical protein
VARPDDQSSGYETAPDQSGLAAPFNPIYRVRFNSSEIHFGAASGTGVLVGVGVLVLEF